MEYNRENPYTEVWSDGLFGRRLQREINNDKQINAYLHISIEEEKITE